MPRLDYAVFGKTLMRLASDNDRLVGKALDDLDWMLAQAGSSWERFGKEVAGLAQTARSQAGPRSPSANGDRPPSQWKIDKDDVVKAHARRDELDAWAGEFLESVHKWCVEDGKGLTGPQRDKLHEQLDKLGL